MTSLILKDLIMLKSYAKTLIIMIGFFALVTFSNDASFLSGMIILILAMLPVTSFSFDQQSKWDLFSQTLPVSRKQLVWSKYLLGLIAIGSGVVIASLLNGVILLLKNQPVDLLELVVANIAIAYAGILFLAVLIPLVYQFGVEKSRLISLAVLAVPSLLAVGLSRAGVSFAWLDSIAPALLFGISSLVVVLVFLLSTFVSIRIYSKKDF